MFVMQQMQRWASVLPPMCRTAAKCHHHVYNRFLRIPTFQSPQNACNRSAAFKTFRTLHRSSKARCFVTAPALPDVAIYERPDLYEAAFDFRDFEAEVGFLLQAHAKYCGAARPTSLLELGCGPAQHSIAAAKRGLRVWALDNNATMLAHARSRADEAGADVAFIQADMRDLQPSFFKEQSSVDMVVCLLGTFQHMLTNKDAARVFQAVHQCLAPDGLFVLELAHPGDLFDGTLIIQRDTEEMWETEWGDRKVFCQWGAAGDDFDPITQVLQRTVSMTVMNGDNAEENVEEVVPQRFFTVQELDLLATMHGFKVVGLHGEMKLEVGLDDEEAYRLLACFRKEQ